MERIEGVRKPMTLITSLVIMCTKRRGRKI